MRVFVITQDEPIYAPLYLSRIFDKAARNHRFVGITGLSPFGKKGTIATARQRLGMYGALDFSKFVGLFALRKAVGFLPLSLPRPYSIQKFARAAGIPLINTGSVNDPQYLERLESLEIDVLLSVAANQRFSSNLLRIPKVACLNVHSSLLPDYRGLDALFWALSNGEERVGVSVHVMNSSFDDGAIVLQDGFAVRPKDSLHRLYLEAIEAGSGLISRSLDLYARDEVVLQTNDSGSSRYYSWPTREAALKLRARGHSFF